MHRQETGRERLGKPLLWLGLGAAAVAFSGNAMASCSIYTSPLELPQSWRAAALSEDAQTPAALASSSDLASRTDGGGSDRSSAPGIVGTWRFTFISDGTAYPVQIPYGVAIDFGTTQWHSDGTEFTISGGRAPSTGDVCMGAWKQTGRSTFSLRHMTLTWVSPDSTPPAPKPAYIGPGIIREVVKLSRSGNRFEGTFTIDQYSTDEVTVLQHIGGKVVGTRFTAD